AILREIEGHGATGELRLPEIVGPPATRSESLLPARLKPAKLRGAFDLVAALHFIGDQTSAAHTALAGIAELVEADCWTIYLFSETKGSEAANLEPLARFEPAAEALAD